MGLFKQFISGAKEAIHQKKADENIQRIALNLLLFSEKKISKAECISNISYLTAEQVKYIVFHDIDKDELNLISFIISSSLMVSG